MSPVDEQHRIRPNRLDRIFLLGRDPDRKVNMLDHIRLQYGLIAGIVIITVFSGFIWWSLQDYAHKKCVERNQAAVVSRQILGQLVKASKVDKDSNQAQVWQQWLTVSGTTVPKC